MGVRRVFIAVTPPVHIIKSLERTVRSYQKEDWGKDVRWVKLQNLHLTLKFIGKIENTYLNDLYSVIHSSLYNFGKFTLETEGLSLFPKPFNPKIISVGIVDNPDLNELVNRIENSLIRVKIPKEKRKFKGHITIGRCKKTFPKKQKIENYVENLKFPVNEVVIYNSDLRPEGPEYSILKKIKLY